MNKQMSLSFIQDELKETKTHKREFLDVNMTSKLLHGEEETVGGDSGYIGAEKREDAIIKNKNGKKIKYNINRRPSQYKKNSKRPQAQIKRREHEKSSVRAKVEHVFAVVKGQLRYRKTRYRGLLYNGKQKRNLRKIKLWFFTEKCRFTDQKPLSS